jgi:hypothetical protein
MHKKFCVTFFSFHHFRWEIHPEQCKGILLVQTMWCEGKNSPVLVDDESCQAVVEATQHLSVGKGFSGLVGCRVLPCRMLLGDYLIFKLCLVSNSEESHRPGRLKVCLSSGVLRLNVVFLVLSS